MEMTWEMVQFEEMERMKEEFGQEFEGVGESVWMGDNVGERGKVVWGDHAAPNLLLPPTLYIVFILVLKLTV